MSGLVKGVKKAFKKVGKVLKKIVKPLLIATAAYFTAGVALSFIPATSAFAASLPGFASGGSVGLGIGSGATAGTGIFSTVASTVGLGGGLASGAASLAAPAAGASTFAYGANAVGTGVAATGASAAAGGGAVAGAAKVGMSLTDKLLLAKVGTDVAGALFGPSPEEEYASQYEEANRWRGSFYGVNADGSGAPEMTPPQAPSLPEPTPINAQHSVTAEQQALLDGRETRGLFPTSGSNNQDVTEGFGAMKTNLPVPDDLFSAQPGVRYI